MPHLAALALAVALTNTSAQSIDFSPLVPAVNGLIATLATVLIAATPFFAWYIVQWLRGHGVKVSAEAQQKLGDILEKAAVKGFDYARVKSTIAVDAELNTLKIPVGNELVATAANYTLAQIPDTLKKLGIDPATPEGQAQLVRFLTARLIPTAPPANATVDLNVNTKPRTGEEAVSDALNSAQLKGRTP